MSANGRSATVEERVIGTVLANPHLLAIWPAIRLETDHFAAAKHRHTWDAIRSLEERRETIDGTSLLAELERNGYRDVLSDGLSIDGSARTIAGWIEHAAPPDSLVDLFEAIDAAKADREAERAAVDAAVAAERAAKQKIEDELDEIAMRDLEPGTEVPPPTSRDAEPSWDAALDAALDEVRKKLGAKQTRARRLFGTDATELLGREFPPTQWQVSGLIPKIGTTVAAGEPKMAIKSWITTEGAIAIATGTPMFGEFYTAKGVVAYLYAEDPAQSVRNRSRALLAGANRRLEPNRLFLQPRGEFIDVLRDEDLAWIVASVRALPSKIDVLVLEPLRDIHGGEEDKSDSMRDVMRRLRALGELLDCGVWLAHHTPKTTKDNAKRRPGQNMRGSSAIHGSIDCGLYVEPIEGDGTNAFRVRVTSQIKSARSAGVFELGLTIVDDDNGEACSAAWTFSRGEGIRTAAAHDPKTGYDDAKVFDWVVRLASEGTHRTRTDLRSRLDRPVSVHRFRVAIDRLIAIGRLRLEKGIVFVGTSGE